MTLASSTLSSAPTPRARRRGREALFLLGLLALFAVGLGGLALAGGWQESWAQVARLSLWQIGLLLLLSLANYGLRGLRWHLFSRRLGLGLPLSASLRHFLGGFAMTVTPGRVGELVRMRWISRETGWRFTRSAPLVLVDRASDLAAMGAILALSLSLSTMGITGAFPVAALALIAAIVATRPALLTRIVTVLYRLLGRAPRAFGRIRSAARSLTVFSTLPTIAGSLSLGAAGWLAEGIAFALLLGWMGADIGLFSAIAIFVFSTLAGGLTGAPGGIGGAEAAMIALLKLHGIPLEVSVPATAIIRITTLWFAIGIGILAFPAAERASLKATTP
ncbi:lysylphosphatidylglycerol synthase transmembrane domain-containing protein [Vannielia sp.]|uniref:lysylphosphatidylglycerol synthase transmembrane domain-containing protein n=1 Tax=Vannielia sp. TaxID=2813045 RepID=UPI0026225B04|nr:lysylphosphatidylglycerol synthase transmembrane domain-containing protein [Vannielia sp.]MDF1872272.1 lysylphosphatidylglycerol synthase transmembrane domain-containing protein [Vannielia sp.]